MSNHFKSLQKKMPHFTLNHLFSKRGETQFDLSGLAIRKTATYGVMIFALLSAIGLTASFMDLMNASIWLPVAYILFLMMVGIVVIRRIDNAVKHLKRHHALLKEAFQYAPAGRVIIDQETKRLYANEAFPDSMGIKGKVTLDKIHAAFKHDPEMDEAFAEMRRSADQGEEAFKELTILDKKGQKRWISINVLPVMGQSNSIQWRFEDISDRINIQEKIKEEQSKLSDFLNTAHVGFYAVDKNGHFLYVNKTFANWVDCDPDKLVKSELCLHDFIVEDCRAYPSFGFTNDDKTYQEKQLMIKSLSGKVFRASIGQTLVKDESGEVEKTRSIVRDMTPEHEWQTALRLSNQRFELFFQSGPNGIAFVNAKGKIDECNQAFSHIAGVKVNKLINKKLIDLFKEDSRKELEEKLTDTLNFKDVSFPIEVELQDEARTIQLFAKCLDIGDIEENALIVHIIDHTNQKNLEIQFSQSQKMQAIGQLAGGVAHDFNNLLTAMIGFCDLLLTKHMPGDSSYGDLMLIKQNANRGANLVRQLLAFSRKQTLKTHVMAITDMLADLSNLLSRLIGEQIQLNMYHGRDLGQVRVDQGQFEQVIINLVVNARDAMQQGGEVNIKTYHLELKKLVKNKPDDIPPGDYVCIEVSDTGTGIAKQDLERIFDPFFSTKEVGSGTGLGLSTVYGIVSQSKGYIRVESTLNKGSKFIVYLPRITDEVSIPEVVKPIEVEKTYDLTGGETILLVEDEDPVRMFSTRALKNKGYKVIESHNGELALEILKERGDQIDLLISDVVMPNMDGPTLYKNVQKTNPDLRFIFMSGYAEDRFQDQFENMDELHFLPKPFTLKELAAKVKEVLSESK